MSYAELQCTSHFSFLRGASSCEELFAQAAVLGIEALAITDRNSLAGIVRAHEAAKVTGVRLIVGCRLDLTDGSLAPGLSDRPARLWPALPAAVARQEARRQGEGACSAGTTSPSTREGLIAVLVPDRPDAVCGCRLRRLADTFGERAHLALTLRRRPRDQLRLHQLAAMAAAGAACAPSSPTTCCSTCPAGASCRMSSPASGTAAPSMTLGFRRERHADRYLKPPAEMQRLFARYPEALARTLEIADRCRFSLTSWPTSIRQEVTIPGLTPQQALAQLTWEGAAWRYPEGVPDKVRRPARARAAADREACATRPIS